MHRINVSRWAVILLSSILQAASNSERLRPINDVATALSAGNPVAAMAAFDKSLSDFDQLSARFTALTAAFDLNNEIDVEDEQDSPSAADLTLQWTLTLTSQTNDTEHRTAEIHARVGLRDGKWKIVAFSPIDLFDPQPRASRR